MDIDEKVEALAVLIKTLSDQGRGSFIAKLLVKLQLEYVDLAMLATDGEYVAEEWTHNEVMDFLTKGER